MATIIHEGRALDFDAVRFDRYPDAACAASEQAGKLGPQAFWDSFAGRLTGEELDALLADVSPALGSECPTGRGKGPCTCPREGARGILYLNAYSVTRHRGGSQEGGWYYDAGEPMSSSPILAEWRASRDGTGCHSVALRPVGGRLGQIAVQVLTDQIRELIGWPQEGQGRFRVGGGADFVVLVEDHFARAWPDEVPSYQ